MKRIGWCLALGLSLLASAPAQAEILKGVMGIKGAEMSWWGGMARDAIARQYDVEKNAVKLVCETESGSYRPGTIAFAAKNGKTIGLAQIEASLRATRLSGGTNMQVTHLEVTVAGDVVVDGKDWVLKGSGSARPFVLAEAPDDGNAAFRRLREALERGEKVVNVTGRVEGWSGRFPVVLQAQAAEAGAGKSRRLLVMDFQTAKK